MADQTCLEYLIQCAGSHKQEHLTQDILLNASNEFRNIWNLVKKLQSVARIDVKKITRFLDNVQEGLETKKWVTARTNSVYADHEYKQIKKYIRASYLDDYKVIKFIDTAASQGKSKSQKDSSVHQRRKQTFRNMQINKQQSIKIEKQISAESNDGKPSQKTKVQSKTTVERREVGDGQEKVNTIKKTADGKTEGALIGKDKLAQIEISNSTHDETLNSGQPETNISGDNPSDESCAVTKSDKSKTLNGECTKQEQHADMTTRGQFKNTNSGNEDNQLGDVAVTDSEPINKEDISLEKDKETGSEQSIVDQDKLRSSMVGKDDSNTRETTDKERVITVNGLLQTLDDSTENENSQDDEKEAVLEVKPIQKQSLKYATESPIDGSNSSLKQNIPELSQRMETKVEHTSEPNDDENKSITSPSGKGSELSTRVQSRLTSLSVECNIKEIVEEVAVVFKKDWDQSFKTLTSCEPSNGLKNSISFLGEILKVSAEKVKKAKETKRQTGESNTVDDNSTLCTQKEDFLRTQLRHLRDKFCISNNNPDGTETVNTYAAKCVELAWFMTAQSPPLMFDYDSRPMLLEDLFKLFKPYKNKGKFIQFVVWPAIRRCGTCEIIEKGIAEFR